MGEGDVFLFSERLRLRDQVLRLTMIALGAFRPRVHGEEDARQLRFDFAAVAATASAKPQERPAVYSNSASASRARSADRVRRLECSDVFFGPGAKALRFHRRPTNPGSRVVGSHADRYAIFH